ncbi:MAG: molybdenum cofactor biosynthesis protein MoaE [Blastocatellia bacterium]|nr:molybdenum cofactor biosynthesis protein MoaE [Blastocatellia bacterium]MCS7156945.1 molybdenum cofactor biosynthesis protein MoaE [Blastocatellia bacterium]MCX7752146.1 molybdenum cofactor biosynthesis protein MoaE [Blastocatellia bacterium]MDW8167637.1 molybdenum cofactor biosynthesis protein MoaE [Acidobacteriota bacterium]MDW8256237.1 molybdenum cofactor biosynthesis protein MoaE [Acidobacteriota bacterium]
MIAVKVRFFAQCHERAGTAEYELLLPPSTTVAQALEELYQRFPTLGDLRGRILTAVNEQYATPETPLHAGDILALLPPVSGGQEEDIFELVREPINAHALVRRLLRGAAGAVVIFEGVVREQTAGRRVRYLEYEAYEEMALRMLRQIGREIHERWSIDRIGILHRLGRLEIGESSVVIVVTSAHRRPAFEACEYAINRLKKIVPIWKREHFEDGSVWVEGEWPSLEELPRSELPPT